MLGPLVAMQSLLGFGSNPAAMPPPSNPVNITSNPTLQFIEQGMSLLPSWMQIDLSTLAALVIMAGSVWQPLLQLSESLYWAIVRFFTASISIAPSDKLSNDVVNYIAAEVIPRGGSRVVTARSEYIGSRRESFMRSSSSSAAGLEDPMLNGRVKPIEYLPGFQMIVFRFGWNLMMVTRVASGNTGWLRDRPGGYANAPLGEESVVIMCLGRSIEPIKRLLEHCRRFSDHQRDRWIAVRSPISQSDFSRDGPWGRPILRPARLLTTVHFDAKAKEDLVSDICRYLDPATKDFYLSRGIPYRRGYLLHGPPGTGKSSLALALASLCQLDLYLLHLPSIGDRGDDRLTQLFQSLPARCIVLLEDIDAVGLRRDLRPRIDKVSAPNRGHGPPVSRLDQDRASCTLSGLLNVLDGVASQEGRIVLMTSNHPEKLDAALIRPGRVDKSIFLGCVDVESASSMFVRMFATDAPSPPSAPTASAPGSPSPLQAWESPLLASSHQVHEVHLATLAARFAAQIPGDTFTPAQLQGFLLKHRGSAGSALSEVANWVVAEKQAMKDAEELKKVMEANAMAAWAAVSGNNNGGGGGVVRPGGPTQQSQSNGVQAKEGPGDAEEESGGEGEEREKEKEKKEDDDKGTKPATSTKDVADDVKDDAKPQVNSKVPRRKEGGTWTVDGEVAVATPDSSD